MTHTVSTQTATQLSAGTWTVDPAHSEVTFTIRHLMSKVRGAFTAFTGEITAADDDPTHAKVAVAIDTSSISTNNDQRDAHIRSNDILGTEADPQMTFVSTGISGDADGYVITGDLTIKGVTKSVDLAAEFLGVGPDHTGGTRLGAEASTTINRHDFGVDFNVPLDGGKVLLGDKVDIQLTVEAVKA